MEKQRSGIFTRTKGKLYPEQLPVLQTLWNLWSDVEPQTLQCCMNTVFTCVLPWCDSCGLHTGLVVMLWLFRFQKLQPQCHCSRDISGCCWNMVCSLHGWDLTHIYKCSDELFSLSMKSLSEPTCCCLEEVTSIQCWFCSCPLYRDFSIFSDSSQRPWFLQIPCNHLLRNIILKQSGELLPNTACEGPSEDGHLILNQDAITCY